MSAVFLKILNMSIAAGFIVLAVVLLRGALVKAPKWLRCALWAVVALRLVLPVLPASPFSLIPSAETFVVRQAEKAAGASESSAAWQTVQSPEILEIHSGIPFINEALGRGTTGAEAPDLSAGNGLTPGAQGDGFAASSQGDGSAGSSPGADAFGAANGASGAASGRSEGSGTASQDPEGFGGSGSSSGALQGLLAAAPFIWAAGVVIMAVYAAASYTRLGRKVSAAIKLEGGAAGPACSRETARIRALMSAGGPEVFVCDEIASPFILGVLRPRIYLPSGLSEEDKALVLAHEEAHLARRDQLWKPLGFALLAVYWFNPLMWLGYVLFCRDIELACDEKVIAGLAAPERAGYSRALLSCSMPRRSIAACPLAFGEVSVKSRVRSVLSYKKPAFWIIIVAVIVCVVLALCFLTNPKEKAMQGEIMKWFDAPPEAEADAILTEYYPGIIFRYDPYTSGADRIHVLQDGEDKIAIEAAFCIENAYFCDINRDGKPELCTTCTIGSGIVDQRIIVYEPESGKTYELSDRGNFDYSLAVYDNSLIVQKRAYDKTSSVGADGLLLIESGQLVMGKIPAANREAALKKPPVLSVSAGEASLKVDPGTVSWHSKTYNRSIDGVGLENEEHRKGLKIIETADGSLELSFPVWPDTIEVGFTEEKWLEKHNYELDKAALSGHSIFIPGGEHYCSVSCWWTSQDGGASGDAHYLFKVKSGAIPAESEIDRLILEDRDYIQFGSYRYYRADTELVFSTLPPGYEFAGILENQPHAAGLAGAPYYISSFDAPMGSIYVYMKTEQCKEVRTAKGINYVTTQEYRYVPWIMYGAENASGTRIMTLTDVERMAQFVGKNLSWDNLEDYFSVMPYSGRYCRHFFIAGTGISFEAEGVPLERAELISPDGGERLDIRSGDLAEFLKKYHYTLKQAEEYLLWKYPNMFGLDVRSGLTVWVENNGLENYSCGLLESGQPLTAKTLTTEAKASPEDMKSVLAAYGLPAEMITLRQFTSPGLDRASIPSEAFKKLCSDLFDGRFEVGNEIHMEETSVPGGRKMELATLFELAKRVPAEYTWADFEGYEQVRAENGSLTRIPMENGGYLWVIAPIGEDKIRDITLNHDRTSYGLRDSTGLLHNNLWEFAESYPDQSFYIMRGNMLTRLQRQYPELFELDTKKGLTVIVNDGFLCGLYAGQDPEVESKDIIGKNARIKDILEPDEVKCILSWYMENKGLRVYEVVLRHYRNMFSSYIDPHPETFSSRMSSLFADRYKVGTDVLVKYPGNISSQN